MRDIEWLLYLVSPADAVSPLGRIDALTRALAFTGKPENRGQAQQSKYSFRETDQGED